MFKSAHKVYQIIAIALSSIDIIQSKLTTFNATNLIKFNNKNKTD